MDANIRPITLFFSDLEGSTRLWEEFRGRMAEALARHDTLAREVVERHRGRLVKTTGDGVHAVFDDPADGVAAALEFQLFIGALAAEIGVPLRVRCGMHAGVAQSRDGDFYGSAVNRAARIMSAAHGGQVLLSQAIIELIGERLPAGAAVRELGRVRLRDLATPQSVYQLVHPGLSDGFPALRSLDSAPNNLPLQTTPLLGRQGVIAELRALLGAGRLVTITGPGGIGKTRVALQLCADVLDRFEDGVWLAELAAIADPALVPATVAQALGVREVAQKSVEDSIVAWLASRRALLLLDNCEHVLAAVASLTAAVLRAAPHAHIVATSQEPLSISGERLYPLPALALPGLCSASVADAARFPAVALFVERARAQLPNFSLTDRNALAVVDICQRLDGIPLAIELAAARVRVLSIEEIHRRLDDRFRLLAGGDRTVLPRHRTLEALVAWSYDLLDEPERVLFDRLGVFAGSFDLGAVEQVCGESHVDDLVLDKLAALVDKSLVAVLVGANGEAPGMRYRLLETLRAYALAHLNARGEGDVMRSRHALYFSMLVRDFDAGTEAEQTTLLKVLDGNYENLRAAFSHLSTAADGGIAAAEMALGLLDFWLRQGRFEETRRWLDTALGLPAASKPGELRARLRHQAADVRFMQSDFAAARVLGDLALEDFRALDDRRGTAKAHTLLAKALARQGDPAPAQQQHRQALALYRELGDREDEARSLMNIGTTYYMSGAFDQARHYTEKGREVARAIGHVRAQASAEINLACLELELDRFGPAQQHYQVGLMLARQIGDQYIELLVLAGMSQIHLGRGELAEFRGFAGQVLERFLNAGMHRELSMLFDDIAHAATLAGNLSRAARLYGAAETARHNLGFSLSPSERTRLDIRIAAARAAAGQETFAVGSDEGKHLSLDQALVEARNALDALVVGAQALPDT